MRFSGILLGMGLAAWEGKSGFGGGGGIWFSLASLMWAAVSSSTPLSAFLLHFLVFASLLFDPGGSGAAFSWEYSGVEGKQSCCEVLRCRAEPGSLQTTAAACGARMTRIRHASSLGTCQETCSQ